MKTSSFPESPKRSETPGSPDRGPSPPARRARRAVAPVAAAAAVVALAGAGFVRAGEGGDPEIPVFVLFLSAPDVTVLSLTGIVNHGTAGGFRAYSIGTVACNAGNLPLDWCDEPGGCGDDTSDEDHPVIAQNLYRLKAGRFEQIGLSWLKHGFSSTNDRDPACAGNCVQPPLGSDQLGVGCTDTYSASLNGSRPLGRRSEVDPATADFPYPFNEVPATDVTSQRIRVAESDLAPALNPGARYWMEAHYVARDDAGRFKGFNNASHREVIMSGAARNLAFTGPTVRKLPAIAGWALADPEVDLVPIDVPRSRPPERFHVARKATATAGGWHYEYAVHNLDSDRAANRFTISFPGGATISDPGFHAIAHHSGEPYSTAPWTADLSTPGAVSWSTAGFGADPNANALRWGTVFSFWFDSTAGPEGIDHALGLFKPGTPAEIRFSMPVGD